MHDTAPVIWARGYIGKMPASAPQCSCNTARLPFCTARHCTWNQIAPPCYGCIATCANPCFPDACSLTTALLQGRTGLQHGAFVPAALATVTVVTPLEGPTGAAPLAASLRQLKPSNYQTLQAILAQALVAGAEAEQNTEPPSACSPPHGSPTFRIAAVQPIQPATSATATAAADALPVAAAPVAPPECPQSQQAGSTAMRALRACARLLTGQRRHEHPTLEQELAEQVLHMVQAAAASQPIPAEQHSKTLVQAVAAWYVDNVLQEPRALIKDG